MKILFIHGLASSGAYKMASTLRILIKGSEVISPDVPIEPDEALDLLEGICRDEDPDLVVGLSLGGFWAQKLRGRRKILINPDFHISDLLESMMGEVKYREPTELNTSTSPKGYATDTANLKKASSRTSVRKRLPSPPESLPTGTKWWTAARNSSSIIREGAMSIPERISPTIRTLNDTYFRLS